MNLEDNNSMFKKSTIQKDSPFRGILFSPFSRFCFVVFILIVVAAFLAAAFTLFWSFLGRKVLIVVFEIFFLSLQQLVKLILHPPDNPLLLFNFKLCIFSYQTVLRDNLILSKENRLLDLNQGLEIIFYDDNDENYIQLNKSTYFILK